jgi:hypothetical protein
MKALKSKILIVLINDPLYLICLDISYIPTGPASLLLDATLVQTPNFKLLIGLTSEPEPCLPIGPDLLSRSLVFLLVQTC